ncbi:hypothetical protein [Spiroplasma cantharicola]|uniref:Uncharacterized protein n=1 Tax=Spiroplasma cantharicola TaxID=362837 RepID=A0A0M3SJB2_9MOLU|nr:hypothetical protein [Spiroplasma cantharicola]ALD66448.1 hypothetical protein SCANT_v1c05420 [Spiroplasma cantharicola]
MEANKIYQNSIFLLANLIKDEKLRVELLNNLDYKKQVIELVNNLLILEIDENCSFKDKKWGPIFGKSLVNITKEKIKFVKPDNKTIDDILSDITYLQTYCFNNLQIARDTLTDESFELSEEFVKENSKISNEMKEKYLKSSEKTVIEPEIVDKQKEKPNTEIPDYSNMAGAQSAQGNPFMGTVPLHPLQDPRFYPYNNKPKYTKWLKLSLAISIGIFTLLFIVLSIFVQVAKPYLIDNEFNSIAGFSQEFQKQWKEFLSSEKVDKMGWLFANSLGMQAGGMGIAYIIIMALIISWTIYTIVQPPKTYRQKFIIPGMTLVIPSMFLIMMAFSFIKGFSYIFGSDVPLSQLSGSLFNVAKQQGEKANFSDWYNLNQSGIKELLSEINSSFNMTGAKVLFWLFFVSLLMTAGTIILTLCLNPKLDRDKISKANHEYQTMIAEAMQGRKYEMDQSIYEDKKDIDDFLAELQNGKNKHNNKNKNDEKDQDA